MMLNTRQTTLSVLSVEPYGMKPGASTEFYVWIRLSVLSVEPYGMKQNGSAQRVADALRFQCSRSSRMG